VRVAITAGTGFVGRHLAERFPPLVRRTLPCFRVIENAGEHGSGPWLAHEAATTHVVQAKLELGQNVAATLHKEDAVIVVVREYTESGEALTLPSPPFNATPRPSRRRHSPVAGLSPVFPALRGVSSDREVID